MLMNSTFFFLFNSLNIEREFSAKGVLMANFIYRVEDIVAGRGLQPGVPYSKKIPTIEVSCGDGIAYGTDNAVIVNVGEGLTINSEKQVTVDSSIYPDNDQKFTVVTSAKFVAEGYQIVFAVEYTEMIVRRNFLGIVLSIEPGEVHTEFQPFPNGYGSSSPFSAPQPVCKSENVDPSFYK
jgi:hypothetical protein